MTESSSPIRRLLPYEYPVFIVLCFLNSFPLFLSLYLPCLDGPAHLHNATLIANLLSSGGEPVAAFYSFNEVLVPNWTGHLLQALLSLVLPMYVVEKVVLAFYIIGVPLVVRYVVSSFESGGVWVAYMALPFAYSMVFLLGFYNFSLGCLIALVIIGKYLRKKPGETLGFVSLLSMALLFLLLYFSHPVPFMLASLVVVIMSLSEVKDRRLFAKNLRDVVLVLFVPMMLFGLYLFKGPLSSAVSFLSTTELLSQLVRMETLAIPNVSKVSPYNYLLLGSLTIVLIAISTTYIKRVSINRQKLLTRHARIVFGTMSLLLIALYFLVPDSAGSGGYISVRIAWWFFITLLLWMSTHRTAPKLIGICILFMLICQVQRIAFLSRYIAKKAMTVKDISAASTLLPEGSVILPLNTTDAWETAHYSNYLGANRPMVILENYEAGTGYFPLKWNANRPEVQFLNQEIYATDCLDLPIGAGVSKIALSHLFILGENSGTIPDCLGEIDATDLTRLKTIYEGDYCSLIEVQELNTP